MKTRTPIGIPVVVVIEHSKLTGHFWMARGLQFELGCLLCWFAPSSFAGQESESNLVVASLSMATAPLQPCGEYQRKPSERWAIQLTEPRTVVLIEPRRALTDAEAWKNFDRDYRPERRNPSPVKHQIEVAKYGLDTTIFAVYRFVKSIRDHADYSFEEGHLRPSMLNTRGGFLANPRVKLDIDMTHGKAFIGARVVIPFGN